MTFAKALRTTAILLLAYTLVAGFFVLAVSLRAMLVDFPCFAYYSEQEGCVSASPYLRGDESGNAQIEVLLTVGGVGIGGGGCNRQASETDLLELRTAGITMNLDVADDALKVNGAVVEKGEMFQARRIFYLMNPWLASEASFKNQGRVTFCDAREARPRFMVIGNSGVRISWQNGLLLLFACGGLFVFAHGKVRRGLRE